MWGWDTRDDDIVWSVDFIIKYHKLSKQWTCSPYFQRSFYFSCGLHWSISSTALLIWPFDFHNPSYQRDAKKAQPSFWLGPKPLCFAFFYHEYPSFQHVQHPSQSTAVPSDTTGPQPHSQLLPRFQDKKHHPPSDSLQSMFHVCNFLLLGCGFHVKYIVTALKHWAHKITHNENVEPTKPNQKERYWGAIYSHSKRNVGCIEIRSGGTGRGYWDRRNWDIYCGLKESVSGVYVSNFYWVLIWSEGGLWDIMMLIFHEQIFK